MFLALKSLYSDILKMNSRFVPDRTRRDVQESEKSSYQPLFPLDPSRGESHSPYISFVVFSVLRLSSQLSACGLTCVLVLGGPRHGAHFLQKTIEGLHSLQCPMLIREVRWGCCWGKWQSLGVLASLIVMGIKPRRSVFPVSSSRTAVSCRGESLLCASSFGLLGV